MEIKLINVTSKNKKKYGFTNLNLEIKSNTITSIIGIGKTSLFETILGIEKISSGIILFGGEDIKNNKNILSSVSYIVENPETQYIHKTVQKEVERISTEYNRILEAFALVGLEEEILKKNPHNLSNGEKRKLALSLAIINDSDLIIIDEPSLGLDNNSKKNLAKLLKKIKKSHEKTILMASNDIDFVHMMSDEVVILADNQIIFQGDKYRVFQEEEILKKYGIGVPELIKFSNLVKNKKKIKIGYRDEINDLIKDIYRYVK